MSFIYNKSRQYLRYYKPETPKNILDILHQYPINRYYSVFVVSESGVQVVKATLISIKVNKDIAEEDITVNDVDAVLIELEDIYTNFEGVIDTPNIPIGQIVVPITELKPYTDARDN